MELYGKNAKELVLHFAKIAFSSGID